MVWKSLPADYRSLPEAESKQQTGLETESLGDKDNAQTQIPALAAGMGRFSLFILRGRFPRELSISDNLGDSRGSQFRLALRDLSLKKLPC